MTLPKNIKELRNPDTLKSGHITKMSNGRMVVVKRNKYGKAKYKNASKSEINCSKTLKKNINYMLNEVKTKKSRIKTYPQALAIAYSKTQKAFPKCELVKKTKTKLKTNKNTSNNVTNNIQQGSGRKRVKIQRDIIKTLMKKGYIQKIKNTICKPVKKIKHLYKETEYSEYQADLKNISKSRYSNGIKMDLNTFLKLINDLIYKCNNTKTNFYGTYFNFINKINIRNTFTNTDEKEKFKLLLTFVKNLP